jgi:hypothetical protein
MSRSKNLNNPLPRDVPTEYPVHVSFRVTEETFKAMTEARGQTHMSRWVRGLMEQLTGTEKKNGHQQRHD